MSLDPSEFTTLILKLAQLPPLILPDAPTTKCHALGMTSCKLSVCRRALSVTSLGPGKITGPLPLWLPAQPDSKSRWHRVKNFNKSVSRARVTDSVFLTAFPTSHSLHGPGCVVHGACLPSLYCTVQGHVPQPALCPASFVLWVWTEAA